jgi:hypothetical protein
MTREKYAEITIHLDNIHHLFTAPEGDPFSEKVGFVSGIEFIKSELKPATLGSVGRTKVTIFLPKVSIEPNLAGKTKDALQRYCQFRIRQNNNAMALHRSDALKALLGGIMFLLSGLILTQFVEKVPLLPSFLNSLFSSGFDIAVWVILWRPVDFFLFDLWPYWREDRIYKHLMQMEIIVAEEH